MDFCSLLADANIQAQDEVLELLERWMLEQAVSCSSSKEAVRLYEHAVRLPTAAVQDHLQQHHGISIERPLFDRPELGTGMLTTATTGTGKRCTVKLLDARVHAAEAEASQRLLQPMAQQPGPPLVQGSVLQVPMDRAGSDAVAVLMPRYPGSLADQHKPSEGQLAAGGARMVAALERVHAAGMVHADIKASNVLVDDAGAWFLGDFGSAVQQGFPLLTTTLTFAPASSVTGTPAMPQYDWHMLGVMLVVLLLGKHWQAALLQDGHVPPHKLAAAAQAASDPALAGVLQDVLQRAGVQ